jgi:CheY-like chemotaxis protein
MSNSDVRPKLSGFKVLIAEDNPVNQTILERMLSKEGATSTSTANGREALDLLRETGQDSWSLILTDIQMPVMDGHLLAKEISASYPYLPIVGISAHDDNEEKQRCVESGMLDQISKPVSMSTLVSVVLKYGKPITTLGSQPIALHNDILESCSNANSDSIFQATKGGLIDWGNLIMAFGNRPAFVLKLAEKALKAQSDILKKLDSALAEMNLQEIAFLAHAIKGMGANFQAVTVKEAAAALETAARIEDRSSIPALGNRVLALESTFLEEIRRFYAEQKPSVV